MTTPEFRTDPGIDALVERFPRLFRGHQPEVWSDLPAGWHEVAGRLFADLDALLDDDAVRRFTVLQIKEKFAGLRVYWKLGTEKTLVMDVHGQGSAQRVDLGPKKPSPLYEQITARVNQAAQEAATTCQTCGNGGASAGGRGWLVTLCPTCRGKADRAEAQREAENKTSDGTPDEQ